MVQVIGVRFRNAGKIYYFDPGEEQIARGLSVIVETARGTEMGMVILSNAEVEDDQVVQPLKPIIRIAQPEDFAIVKEHKQKEKEAYRICQEKIREHELEMKLVDVEYTFDGNKLMFYFTADGRVDFRELVKDLASVFKMRIELRQIGVRDETKLLGGIGICGRSLCCHSYLSDFVPVSIKMAKEQNLSLNPTKISGVCGRLMCCLKNEEDTYEYLNKQLPRIGEIATITAEREEGEVQSVNVLRQRVKLLIKTANDDVELKEYPVEALDFGPDRKRPEPKPEIPVFLPETDPSEPQQREKEAGSRASRRGRSAAPHQDRDNEGRNGEASDRQSGNRAEKRAERAEKNERAERRERPAKGENRERGDRRDRQEHRDREEDRQERRDHGEERRERGEHGDRQEHRERGEDRRERGEQGERRDHGEDRRERRERGENRRERGENRQERKERGEHGDNRQERKERGEHNENRQDREDRRDKSQHHENRGEGQERSGRRNRRDFRRRGHGQDKNRQAAEKES